MNSALLAFHNAEFPEFSRKICCFFQDISEQASNFMMSRRLVL